jgi:rRNA processing protein Gar1
MNKTAQNQYNSLMEAYYAVYDDDIRNKLNEEKEIKEFLEIIDFLIEDGYDLSEYTYEELYEYHITERWGGLLKGAGALAGKAGSAIFQGAKGPAKELLKKAGKVAVPLAGIAALDQYLSGGKGREHTGSAIQALRRAGHSIPSPGQAADSIKPYIAAPDISKPSPPKRNLPPAHLTQGYRYGKNNIITEDPAFPSQKPKSGDWSKLTLGGITKLWDPETNSYQLPGTINKRLKSQGEKEITVPGKAPTPSPKPSPSTPAPEAPTPPASTPAPEAPKPPASTPAPTPSRPSSSATSSTAEKIKGGMDVYNKQRSSGDFKAATETGKSVWATANPKLAAAAAERERTRGTSSTTNPLMRDMKSRLPAAEPKDAPKPSPTRSGFGVPTAPLAAKLSAATSTAPPTPTASPKAAPLPPKKETAPLPPKKEIAPPPPKTPISSSYEYDAYDLVLEYLLSQGHADTLEEANYVMLEMDAEMIGDIVEVMGQVQSVPIPIKKGRGDGSNPPSHDEYKEYKYTDEPKLPPTKKK